MRSARSVGCSSMSCCAPHSWARRSPRPALIPTLPRPPTTRSLQRVGATIVVGDIRDRDVVTAVTETALAVEDSRIDILVNNVGDFRPAARDFLHSTEDQWQTLYELNLLHVLRMCHAVLPAMVNCGRGAIVNNATVEAFRGIPYAAPYAAFNAGVVAFTRSLAVDVAQQGIRVNAIAPDLADTPQTPAELMLRGREPDLIRTWNPGGQVRQARRLRGRRGVP